MPCLILWDIRKICPKKAYFWIFGGMILFGRSLSFFWSHHYLSQKFLCKPQNQHKFITNFTNCLLIFYFSIIFLRRNVLIIFGGYIFKYWRGWYQIIGGDVYPPSPPGFAAMVVCSPCIVIDYQFAIILCLRLHYLLTV